MPAPVPQQPPPGQAPRLPPAAPLAVAAPPRPSADAAAAAEQYENIQLALREAGFIPAVGDDARPDEAPPRAPRGRAEPARAIMRAMVGLSTLAAGAGCVYNLVRVLSTGDDGEGAELRMGLAAALSVFSAFTLLDAAHVGRCLLEPGARLRPGVAASLMRGAGLPADQAADLEIVVHPVLCGLVMAAILLTQPVEEGVDFGARMLYPAGVFTASLLRGLLIVRQLQAAMAPQPVVEHGPEAASRARTTVVELPGEADPRAGASRG